MTEMSPESEPVTIVTAGVAAARATAPGTGPGIGASAMTAVAQATAPGTGPGIGASAMTAVAQAGAPVIGGEPPPETMPGWDVQFQAALSQPAEPVPDQDEGDQP